VADLLAAAKGNLLTPPVLFFLLGTLAALFRSDLALPEALGKAISLYLMMSIGFSGGAELAHQGAGSAVLWAMLTALVLSAGMPWIAYPILRLLVQLQRVDCAAIAAHYGSVSVVTFAAASALLTASGHTYEGYLAVMLALMETPAILSGLLLANRLSGKAADPGNSAEASRRSETGALLRETLLSGSVLLLLGSFAIGWLTGAPGKEVVAPFLVIPFKGVLCLFLLDMGLLAGRRLESVRQVGVRLAAFGIAMPLIGATIGLGIGLLLGLSVGGCLLLMVLAGSSSYIVVPAAMRVALPKANPALYVTVSLAVTFPFNLLVGIPIYLWLAETAVSRLRG
jgi:hypothetical protein